ncbi:MAG: hypothetical protein MMC23_006924 [Stictis urceolatum]|nr:hypothetical protein [Stictis urceolata]
MKTTAFIASLALAAPALALPGVEPRHSREWHHSKPPYPTHSSVYPGGPTGTGSLPQPTGWSSASASPSNTIGGGPTYAEPAAPASTGGNSTGAGDLGIPAGCLQKNGISVGWLPDQDQGVKMDAITSKLGAKACFYGLYSQITSSQYDDSQLTGLMDDIKSSGAVLQPAVMPTKVGFSEVTEDLASQIAVSMKKFTDEGITVWLRFAHEVNYYVTDGTYKGGSPRDFVKAWQNVANAVKDNDKVLMYWSPNNVQDASQLEQWFPGAEYVDVVGIDIYPDDSALSSFKGVYGNFYDAFSAKYNIPFAVGETAAGGQDQQKQWLTSLSMGDQSMSNYVGFSWFEYDKEKDWRVVTGSENIAGPILE